MMTKKSILLVDDDQRLRELLKDYLKEKNFHVFTSEDFEEAREILGYFIFDLIILFSLSFKKNGDIKLFRSAILT